MHVEKALLIINVLPGFDLHQRVATFRVVSFVTDLNFEFCFLVSPSVRVMLIKSQKNKKSKRKLKKKQRNQKD